MGLGFVERTKDGGVMASGKFQCPMPCAVPGKGQTDSYRPCWSRHRNAGAGSILRSKGREHSSLCRRTALCGVVARIFRNLGPDRFRSIRRHKDPVLCPESDHRHLNGVDI